jgi:hypothetical protein
MADSQARDVERPQEAAPAPVPAEPATARALWPTFMRRTLTEDALRRETTPSA